MNAHQVQVGLPQVRFGWGPTFWIHDELYLNYNKKKSSHMYQD